MSDPKTEDLSKNHFFSAIRTDQSVIDPPTTLNQPKSAKKNIGGIQQLITQLFGKKTKNKEAPSWIRTVRKTSD